MNPLKSVKAQPFLIFLGMAGVMILIATVVTVSKYSNSIELGEKNQILQHQIHISDPLVHEAKNFSNTPNGAFAFLAMGAQANQLNCPAAIESLVRYGGWDGDVYLITDQAHCFDPKEIVHNAGMKDAKKFHYIVTKERFSTGGIDFHHSKVGFRQSRVRSFAMKTQLFDLIPDPNIEVIAYVDCDILFSFEGCPKKFLEAGAPWKPDMMKFSHVVKNEQGVVEDLHAGAFVVHRQHSAKLLQLWHEQILAGADAGDNNAFLRLYHQHDLPRQNLTATALEVFQPNQWTLSSLLVDPSKDSSESWNWYEKFLTLGPNTTQHSIACMTHISKARCSYYGRENVQSFVDRYHLRTYQQYEASYCTHSLLQPLLYGWFPFGYLPFCPKMEALL